MRVLALNTEGKLTYCTCAPDQRGKGRCNHVAHQMENESPEEFCERVSKFANYIRLSYSEKIDLLSKGDEEDLDVLVNDEDWTIRTEVARHGRDKDLDVLINDKGKFVRAAVARCGRDKDLDVLVNDSYEGVRAAVARHGREKDLEILINDESEVVCAIAKIKF